jgi:glucose/arabinose dehydrogenase/PKD repeat protein
MLSNRLFSSRWSKVGALASAVAVLLSGLSMAASPAGAAPGGFNPALVTDEYVAGGMPGAVAADWLPDGRMVVLTRPGAVWLVNPATGANVALSTLPDVDSNGESGALDLVVDLDFANTHAIYVYYTALSDLRLRIAKLVLHSTASSVVSSTTIWSNPGPSRSAFSGPPSFHMGGSLDIGPDRKLYLSIGDAQAQQSQDMGNVFGKLLRINMDGSVPTDNPNLSTVIPEIYAFGLRNPFRGGFERVRSTTNPLGIPTLPYWAGDVGGNVPETAYEEINIIERGRNYGWPFCEGPIGANGNPLHTVCPAGVTGPVYSYPHTIDNKPCCFNKAIIGGQIYRSGPFPLHGFYIYGDYPSENISWLQLGADGRTAVDSGQLLKLGFGTPGWIDVGPDGAIYYVNLYDGSLHRLTYPAGTNSPPKITNASVAQTPGQPANAQFTGAAIDFDGDAISYLWDFGDGSTSSVASPMHTYGGLGVFHARLHVTAAGQVATSDPVQVNVGPPPILSISGVGNGVVRVGDTITAVGSAIDATDGLMPASKLVWSVSFIHDDHQHPLMDGVIGGSVAFPVDPSSHDFSGNTGYRISLSATNSLGIRATTTLDVHPKKLLALITANIPAAAIVSGVTQSLPFSIDTIPGTRHSLEAPATVCVNGFVNDFVRWSDGQPRVHTVTATEGVGFAATYAPSAARCASKFRPLTPRRVFDSRNGSKPAAGRTLAVPVVGRGGVPDDGVTAVVVNITVVEAVDAGFVTVWPSGSAPPTSSNLNVGAGDTTANLVTVSPGPDGALSILPTSSAHVLVDVVGYYTPAPSSVDGRFVPLSSPQRLYDTRNLGPTPGAGAIRNVGVAGAVGVPAAGAEAVVLNVTAVGALTPGFVTVWPSDTSLPTVSNINLDRVGQTRPNQVIVKLGPDGAFSLYTSGGAHLLVDVVGYFTSAEDVVPVSSSGLFIPTSPVRLLDTRQGQRPAADARIDLSVLGHRDVPSRGVLAVVGNTTAVRASAAGFVTVFPGRQTVPNTSTLNVEAGQTIANHSTTTIGGDGVSFQTTTAIDLLLDLAGWYTS